MNINYNYYKNDIEYEKYNNEEKILEYISLYNQEDYNSILKPDDDIELFLSLSNLRENVIKWYEFEKDSNVLEINDGFGEITGFLCKQCKEVVTIVGSKKRAEAISKRYEDVKNLQIICGKVYDIEFTSKYDYIIYNNVVSFNKDTIDFLVNLLKDDGTLIVMGNNPLGIRYWTGAKFEKDLQPYESIENSFDKQVVNIKNKLNEEKLNYKIFYPFPDYKFTNVIFSDEYLPNFENIERNLTYYNNDDIYLFNETKVLKQLLVENPNFLKSFANSFVFIIKKDDIKINAKFVCFNNGIKDKYRLMTVIGNDKVKKVPVTINSIAHLNEIKNNIDILNELKILNLDSYDENTIISKFVNEKSFDLIILSDIKKNGIESGKVLIKNFMDYLSKKLVIVGHENNVFEKYNIVQKDNEIVKELTYVKYGFWDMLFKNCFYINNNFFFYDQEWLEYNIPLEFILYRNLLYTTELNKSIKISDFIDEKYITYFQKLDEIFQDKIRCNVMFEITKNKVTSLSTLIYNNEVNKLTINHLNNLNGSLTFEKNELNKSYIEVSNQKNEIENEKNRIEDEKNRIQDEKNMLDLKIKNIEEENKDLQQKIALMVNSKSWKITAPLRKVMKIISSNKTKNNDNENVKNEDIINIYSKNNVVKKYEACYKKVSVIIPNYNYEKYIIERIDSVLFQTYPIYELIILDDVSPDNSVEVIENKIKDLKQKYPYLNIIFSKNEKNSGCVFAQWQKGLSLAKGEYVWIAEADDSCDNTFLEKLMKPIEENPNIVLSCCECLRMDQDNKIIEDNSRALEDFCKSGKWNESYINNGIDEITNSLSIQNTILNVSSAIFKNGDYYDILEKAKNYKVAGDWYFYYKLLEKGDIAYNKESLNYFRKHKTSVTKNNNIQAEYDEVKSIQDEIASNYSLSDEIKNYQKQRLDCMIVQIKNNSKE